MDEPLTNRVSTTDEQPPGPNWAGRIWGTGLGLSLIACGAFFCWWLYATWAKASLMDDWVEVPARVVESRVETWRFNEFSKPAFRPLIRYRYEIDGQTHESNRIRRVEVRSSHEDVAAEWVRRHPEGTEARAFVDPRDPARAVLKKDSKAALYSIWFPALFVVGGAGIVWAAWKTPPRRVP